MGVVFPEEASRFSFLQSVKIGCRLTHPAALSQELKAAFISQCRGYE
jgi:hypothetical protein